MEILLKKDLIKFCDWLGTMSKNKEMKNNCKEYYSMANEKKGIRRASYRSKSVSIADLRDMLSWRWWLLTEVGLFARQLRMQEKRKALAK